MVQAPAIQLPKPSVVSVLLNDALIDAGVVGIDETAEEIVINKTMRTANRMFAQWQRQRYLCYQLREDAFVSTGVQSYTVGPGENFNISPRPDRLEFAFLRQITSSVAPPPTGGVQPFDWPLTILDAKEDYGSIRLKNLGTFSECIFYDPGFPVGTLFPWPIPQAGIYEIHIYTKQPLGGFTSVEQTILWPPEYEAAVEWCLARRLCVAFDKPVSPDLASLAREGLNVIRTANVQVPLLQMPRELSRPGDRAYNYRSDTY